MENTESGTGSRATLPRAAILAAAVLVAGAGCTSGSPDPTPNPSPTFRPVTSIQDIMLSVIDPSADAIWESVATIITYEGTEERRPRTDEDWEPLRHDAVRLVEATNLLLMADREVARSGFQSENPGIELEPSEIRALIDEDWDTWERMVRDLYDAGMVMLEAVEAKDADMLFDNGGPLDQACEACHQHYWYPAAVGPPTVRAVPDAAPAPSREVASAPSTATGTIEGHVRLSGRLPGNAVIRMGVDPRCAEINAGKVPVQETVLAERDGSLANVFVRVRGMFPDVPLSDEPVVIDQRDCGFVPRVVGARVGQLVQIRNGDPLLHNVHSLSSGANSFNIGQPVEGMVFEVRLDEEEGMLRIKCDVHRWMTEYVGVVSHPYFAVSDRGGTFTIDQVPAGTQTIEAWHEVYGVLTLTVNVEASAVTVADFTYPGSTT